MIKSLTYSFNNTSKISKYTDKLLVVSIFRIKNLDYEKFKRKYLNKLNKIIKLMNDIFIDYNLCIYYDDSFKLDNKGNKSDYFDSFVERCNKNERIELIHYEFTDFKIDNIFHDETFGTMIRLFPLFNKTKQNNRINIDVDFNIYEFKKIKYYFDKFIKSNKTIYNNQFNCYPKSRTQRGNHILNGFFGNKNKNIFDKRLLLDFLIDLKNNKYKKELEVLTEDNRRIINKKTLFPYGIDEFFTNNILLSKLNIKEFYIIQDININNILNKFRHLEYIFNKEEIEKLNKFQENNFELFVKISSDEKTFYSLKDLQERIFHFLKFLTKKYYFKLTEDKKLNKDYFNDCIIGYEAKKDLVKYPFLVIIKQD